MSKSNGPLPAPATRAATTQQIIQAVWRELANVKDPCNVLSGHDLSVVDMGLINRVAVRGDSIEIFVTFTEPNCLFAYRIIEDMEDLTASLSGVHEIKVTPEPFPLWDESRLSARAREVYADKKARFQQHRIAVPRARSREENQ